MRSCRDATLLFSILFFYEAMMRSLPAFVEEATLTMGACWAASET